MNKTILAIIIVLVILVIGFLGYKYYGEIFQKNTIVKDLPQITATAVDPLNATYMIEGRSIKLVNGKAQVDIVQGSSEKIEVSVFGVPIIRDLNKDGIDDASLFLVYTQGGSGVFSYVAVALKDLKNNSTIGTNAILLGDRIAPQNILVDNLGVITVNYADRKISEPFSVLPSVGITRYFLVSETTLIENSGK